MYEKKYFFNGIAGMLLICYIAFHNVLYGKLFISLNFVIDTVFEILYCLFPLWYLTPTRNVFDLTSLGMLRNQNSFIILQSLFAMIILVRKCIVLMRDLEPSEIAATYWKHIYVKDLQYGRLHETEHLKPWIEVRREISNNIENSANQQQQKSSKFDKNEMYRIVVSRFETININTNINNNAPITTKTTPNNNINNISNYSSNDIVTDIKAVHANDASKVSNISNSNGNKQTTRDIAEGPKTTNLEENQAEGGLDIKYDEKKEQMKPNPININLKEHFSASETKPEIADNETNDEETERLQCRRKLIIIICGLLFILDGILILVLFLGFIKNDFQNKCIDINDDSWLLKHPELNYYNEYCSNQVINMFDEYPCNCRLLSAYGIEPTEFTPELFENSVKHFDDLEGIYINANRAHDDLSGNYSYYFTDEMFKNHVSNCISTFRIAFFLFFAV